jgi:hypothetical protein
MKTTCDLPLHSYSKKLFRFLDGKIRLCSQEYQKLLSESWICVAVHCNSSIYLYTLSPKRQGRRCDVMCFFFAPTQGIRRTFGCVGVVLVVAVVAKSSSHSSMWCFWRWRIRIARGLPHEVNISRVRKCIKVSSASLTYCILFSQIIPIYITPKHIRNRMCDAGPLRDLKSFVAHVDAAFRSVYKLDAGVTR